MHIIPHGRGDEWLRRMIDNRTPGENLDITIDDIQNGILADDSLHICYFDPREVVVLKTPNPILDPPTSQRGASAMYTRARLSVTQPIHDIPYNGSLPHRACRRLLHYNYGAAAVKQWGKNTSILTNRPEVPRPPVPAPVAWGH
ncbi:hypothetical protein BGY98DRAFT_1183550 [Russula aff. rugulosa BPL654]|nr:hypothetical protein BGY98DRAFT_1183550 [Russula aff. rugulosa BPL654]